ncbi:MAG: hypothetical protein WD991_01115 [Candidatus Paceibacterota bacterium]
MIEIKDLLGRFSHLLSGGEAKKEGVLNIINETTGLQVKKEEIEIKNGTVYLNIKPIYKNEILLKKEQILLGLEVWFKNKAPKDIR